MSEDKDISISLDNLSDKDIPEKIPTKFINSRVIVFNPLFASYLYVKQNLDDYLKNKEKINLKQTD